MACCGCCHIWGIASSNHRLLSLWPTDTEHSNNSWGTGHALPYLQKPTIA